MDIKTCSTCACAVRREVVNESDAPLECHRHAIQVVGFDASGDAVSGFPATEPDEWCWEYKTERTYEQNYD